MASATDSNQKTALKIRFELQKIIARIEKIPTLPLVSQQVTAMLHDDDIPLWKLADVIEKDMALAANILKIANSPFYGTISKVSSIDHALAILGLDEVRSILLAFSIHAFFGGSEKAAMNRTQFWKHSIVSSQIARYLMNHFAVQSDGSIFLSGLIHDLGKVILDQYFHEAFAEVIGAVSLHIGNFSQIEKEILGVTHSQVAAKLLRQWKFPRRVIMQVLHHHSPWRTEAYRKGATIIYLANLFAKFVGYPSQIDEKKVPPENFFSSKQLRFVVQNGFFLDEQIIRQLLLEVQKMIADDGWQSLSFLTDKQK